MATRSQTRHALLLAWQLRVGIIASTSRILLTSRDHYIDCHARTPHGSGEWNKSEKLSTAPLVKAPLPEGQFVLNINGKDEGLGAAL